MAINLKSSKHTLDKPVKILAIFGNYQQPEQQIDLSVDKNLITKLPDAEVTIIEPKTKEEVYDALEEYKCDILFFGGHSASIANFDDAKLFINDTEFVTIRNMNNLLKDSLGRRSHPLILAIFNSCDGLGINKKLKEEEIRIPYLITMNYSIHDKVAHKFLRLLLRSFAKEKRSLREAYQRATNFLGDQELDADFLANLILQQTIMPELFWPDEEIETEKLTPRDSWFKKLWNNPTVRGVGVGIMAILLLGFGIPKIKSMFVQEPVTTTLETVTCKQDPTLPNLYSCVDPIILQGLSPALIDQPTRQKLLGVFEENQKIIDEVKAGKLKEKNVIKIALPLTIDKQNSPVYQTAIYTLHGVAYLQDEFNNGKFPNNKGKKLLILIANDPNRKDPDPETLSSVTTPAIAKVLTTRKLDAVIGFYGSKVTFYTLDLFKKNKLVLMSYASAGTRNKQGDLVLTQTDNQTHFFRTPNTTKEMTQLLADYFMDKKKIKNVAIFYNSTDMFSNSFQYEFEQAWTNKGGVIMSQDKYDLQKMNSSDIERILNQANNTQDTAILLCPDPFINNNQTATMLQNTKEVMTLNDGKLPIGGCSVIPAYPKESINPNNLVATVPWTPDSKNITEDQREKINSLTKFGGANIGYEQIRRMALGYDSVMVILESLLLKKDGESLQEYLINRTEPFQGMTGNISFNDGKGNLGSDRIQNVSAIVKPTCDTPVECKKDGNWKLEYEEKMVNRKF